MLNTSFWHHVKPSSSKLAYAPRHNQPVSALSRTERIAMASQHKSGQKIKLGVVLYDGFEPLDVCGPVNLFAASELVDVIYIAQTAGRVTSVTGSMTWIADYSYQDVLPNTAAAAGAIDPSQQQQQHLDWLLVPGGVGSRKEVINPAMLQFLQGVCAPEYGLQLCMSVCTGSAVLAAAGVLDGRRATSNKMVWKWVTSVDDSVNWVHTARWVQDDRFVTSSGVTAGADMAVYVMKQQFGSAVAAEAAKYNEYIPHTNPDEDPFADDSYLPEVCSNLSNKMQV